METVTMVKPKGAREPVGWDEVDARLSRIEALLGPLAQVAQWVEAAPAGVSTLTDIADEWAARDGHMDARMDALHDLLAKLADPGTLRMLTTMIEQAEQLPQMVATVVDIADAAAAEAARQGMPVESLVQAVGRALRGLSRLATAPEVQALFESGMLAPKTLRTLGRVASAVGDAGAHGRPIGLVGALRASRDLGVQRALGFMLSVAREFGRALGEEQPAPKYLEGGHV